MKERPILFSGPMVRAILVGRKTQTRRVVKPQPTGTVRWRCGLNAIDGRLGGAWEDAARVFGCPYGAPGDRLWVRETFCYEWDERNNRWPDPPTYLYRADNHDVYNINDSDKSPWTPSIHMPRAASRLTLEVLNVRVERLQDISERDCVAEGIESDDYPPAPDSDYMFDYRAAYSQLWNSINAKRAPWASNPWVWVIEFRRDLERP